MYDVDKQFGTARDFFNFLLEDNVFEPKHIFDVSEKLTKSYIFRGQAQKDWCLLPAAHREANELENYTPQPPPKNKRNEFVKFYTHAEIRSVYLFLEAADHIGEAPIDYNLFKDKFDGSDNTFKPELLPSIALAQHHGVPTRLLDWTESPFIAAYFAAKSASGQDNDSHFSVICMNTRLFEHTTSIDLVFAPKTNNRFLSAQRGLFTIVNNANSFFNTHGEWPSLDNIINSERPTNIDYGNTATIRLSLPVSESQSLLKLLYKLDISQLTIMPSLDNAAKHLKYKKALWG